jgi:DNA (cytosine-5)-methyltransferase 1
MRVKRVIDIAEDNQEREHLPEWWGSWTDSFGYGNLSDSQTSQKGRDDSDSNRVIRYFSMFTGVGGFERGFQSADGLRPTEQMLEERERCGNIASGRTEKAEQRFSCVGFSEIDKYANQVLRYRFPETRNYGDCTKINPKELPDFEILVGGFPCQSFSIAGKRLGFEDTRGTLFFDIARIAKSKRPRIIFLENVKGLLSHDKGRTFAIILSTLDELGYDVEWEVLNSKHFGVPQNRERVFIIGHIRGEPFRQIFPIGETDIPYPESPEQRNEISSTRQDLQSRNGQSKPSSRNTRFDSTSDEDISQTMIIQSGIRAKGNPRFYDDTFPTIGQDAGTGGGNIPMVLAPNNRKHFSGDGISTRERYETDIVPSLQAHAGSTQQSYLKESSIRRLTPIECERLQGFPDNWTQFGINEKGQKVQMSDTQRYKMMGNAVTVNVIQVITERLREQYIQSLERG